jgi:hypothetical protein
MLRAKKNAIKKISPLITFLKNIKIDPHISYLNKVEKIKYYINYFDIYYKDSLKINVIKDFILKINNETISYSIIKESLTETWFLTCNDLVILYFDKAELEQFEMEFLFSEVYKFVIYYDNNRDCYIAFCLSHKKNEIINVLNNLYVNNNYHHKYFILSHFLRENRTLNRSNKNNINNIDTDETISIDSNEWCCDDEIYLNNLFMEYSLGFIILNKNVFNTYSNNLKQNLVYYDNIGFGESNEVLNNLIKTIISVSNYYKNLPINYINF